MTRPTCASCPHLDDRAAEPSQGVIGACRHGRPDALPLVGQNPITGEPALRVLAVLPPMREGDWCGEHPLMESFAQRHAVGVVRAGCQR